MHFENPARKRVFLAVLTGAIIGGASLCFAGVPVNAYPVKIDFQNRNAMGTMVGARKSADRNQFIGCTSTAQAGARWGYCYAADASGNFTWCWTDDRDVAATMGGLSDYSDVWFSWNPDNSCNVLSSGIYSYWLATQ